MFRQLGIIGLVVYGVIYAVIIAFILLLWIADRIRQRRDLKRRIQVHNDNVIFNTVQEYRHELARNNAASQQVRHGQLTGHPDSGWGRRDGDNSGPGR